MGDPLGLIGGNGGLHPGAGGAGGVGKSGLPAARSNQPGSEVPGAPSFKDVLMENLGEVNKLQADATRAIEDLQTGQRDDVEGVLLATQKADMAFRMLQSVRNKVVQAYNELRDVRV